MTEVTEVRGESEDCESAVCREAAWLRVFGFFWLFPNITKPIRDSFVVAKTDRMLVKV